MRVITENRFLQACFTLVVGALGGMVCWLLSAPLPWMIGAMTVVTTLAVLKFPIRANATFRSVMVAVLGVLLGSSFTPALLSNLSSWPISLMGMVLNSAAGFAIGMFYFRKIVGADPITAFFSATPGGLNEMTMMGAAMGADERTIALSQATRILVVVFVVPFWFRFSADNYAASARAASEISILSMNITDVAVLAACGVVGVLLGCLVRLPASQMLGPLVVSAAVHLAGFSSARPPVELVSAAQVVVGVTIGSRFVGTHYREIVKLMFHGTIFALLLIGLAAISAWIFHSITGLSASALMLAYSPGGVAEMSLVALALSVDVAFVATHHAARICLVLLFARFGLVRNALCQQGGKTGGNDLRRP